MSQIKKYKVIDPQDQQVSFDAKKMEDIYALRQGQVDEPHRHDYYTMLLVKRARGKHLIDFQDFDLGARQVYFISPGQVHQMIEEEASVGLVFTFSESFLAENAIQADFIRDLHLFNDYGYSPPLELSEKNLDVLYNLGLSMLDFLHSDQKFKYQAVGALLKLFLIHCFDACTLSMEENTQQAQASVVLLRSFKALMEERFREWHKVQDYASAMNITSDYLNTSLKSLTGKSAKEHIQSRIIVAAKRLLRFSDLQNKAIAYELGFSEPANFSQFFKKCTGVSPSAFRKEV